MTDSLRVTLVQTDLVWHEPDINRSNLARQLEPLKGKTDLIILPEMFTSGFTNEPDSIEQQGGPSLNWMKAQARYLHSAITGSVVYKTENGNSNRLWFVKPNGEALHYDKTHLFRMGGEHERYLAGSKRIVIDYLGWKILPTICYDLRFPVFCRSCNDYDLMLCVANWPSSRRLPWRSLLQARAIENLAYVVGVNRIGTDGRDWHYSGDSLLVNYKGELVVDEPQDTDFIATQTLSKVDLDNFRLKFPAWMDADDFSLKIKQ